MQYTYTRIDPILESVPQSTDLLHDPVIQKIVLWFVRCFIGLVATGIVLYALTLTLRIVADLCVAVIGLVHAVGQVINVFIAPIAHAHPAGQLFVAASVIGVGYAILRYIISDGKRGVA